MTVLAALFLLVSSCRAAVAPEFEPLYGRMSATMRAKVSSSGEVNLGPTPALTIGSLWGAPEATARFDGLMVGSTFAPALLVVNEKSEQSVPEEGTPYGAEHRVERDVTYTASVDGSLVEVLRLEGGRWEGERVLKAGRETEQEGRALAARVTAALRFRNLDALIRKAREGDVNPYEKTENGLTVTLNVTMNESASGRTKFVRVEEERKREIGEDDMEKSYSADVEGLTVEFSMQGRPERVIRRILRTKRVVAKGPPTQQERDRFRLLLGEIVSRL